MAFPRLPPFGIDHDATLFEEEFMKNIRTTLPTMIAILALGLGTACHRKANDTTNEQTTSRPGATASPVVSQNSPETANAVNAQHDGIIPESNDRAMTPSGQPWSVGEFAGQPQDKAGMGTGTTMPDSSQESGTTMSGTTSPSDQTNDSLSGSSNSGTLTTTSESTSNDGTNTNNGMKHKNTRKKTSTGQHAQEPSGAGTTGTPVNSSGTGADTTGSPNGAPTGPGNPLKH